MALSRRLRSGLRPLVAATLALVGLAALTQPAAAATYTLADESSCHNFGGFWQAGLPECSWEGSPLVVNSGDTLTQDTAVDVLVLNTEFRIYGVLEVHGTFFFEEDYDPSIGGYHPAVIDGKLAIDASSEFVYFTGALTNNGTITLAPGTVLLSTATIQNSGTIIVSCGAQIATPEDLNPGVILGNQPIYEPCETVSSFSQPVDNLPTLNLAKAGSSIPVKFSVTGPNGPVSNLTAADVALTSTQGGEGCSTTAGADSIETYVGASGLQNLGGGNYQYNWATPKTYKGQCRTMTVTVGHGTQSAGFQFK